MRACLHTLTLFASGNQAGNGPATGGQDPTVFAFAQGPISGCANKRGGACCFAVHGGMDAVQHRARHSFWTGPCRTPRDMDSKALLSEFPTDFLPAYITDPPEAAACSLAHSLPMTVYEQAAVQGTRALALDVDFDPRVTLSPQEYEWMHSVDVAARELAEGVLPPTAVLRYRPDGVPIRVKAQDAYDLRSVPLRTRMATEALVKGGKAPL